MVRTCMQWLWNSSHGIRSHIMLNGITGILRVCASLLFIYVCKQLVDMATGVSAGRLEYYVGLLIVAIVLELLLSAWSTRLENRNGIWLKNRLRFRLFSQLMVGCWDGKERYHSGDVVNRLEEDVRVVGELLSKTFPLVCITGFQLLAAFFFLSRLDSRLAWMLLLIMPLFLAVSKFYMKRIRLMTKEIRATDSNVQAHLQENLQHRPLIQSFEQSPVVTEKLGTLQENLFSQVMKQANFTLYSRLMVSAGFAAGYVTAFLWGIKGMNEGAITFGVMTAFLQLVGMIQRPIVELSRQIPVFVQGMASVERLGELEELPVEEQGKSMIMKGEVGIRLENVSFAYPDGERNVIDRFSYDFIPGSRTAIIGETGVGKSTLIRLMLALLHPEKGVIRLYNDNTEMDVTAMTRSNLAYVPQGNTLMSGTVRENLLLGNPDATDEELQMALFTAAAGFVYELPEGLDTLCGERGAGLSEGQAQRICIARGVLRPGNVLLPDEFSASIDAATERLLLERLALQTTGKTVIFITHREVVTEFCDRVIRLEKIFTNQEDKCMF